MKKKDLDALAEKTIQACLDDFLRLRVSYNDTMKLIVEYQEEIGRRKKRKRTPKPSTKSN